MLPVILLISLFFIWGMLENLNDILIAQFKSAFALNDFQSGLVQFAFFIGYSIFAIPASLFISRYSYKTAILFGLLLVCCGSYLFYPAADLLSYYFFLVALFIAAAGCSFLEVSANPYVALLSDEDTAAKRLTFAQAFNGLGAIFAVLLGKLLILKQSVNVTNEMRDTLSVHELHKIFTHSIKQVVDPYMAIASMVVVLGIIIFFTKFPASEVTAGYKLSLRGYRQALRVLSKKPYFMFGILAQFLYVGAQFGIWSYTIRYCMYTNHMTADHASNYILVSLVLFTLGRFISSYVLNYVSDRFLLGLFALINVCLCLNAIYGSGMSAVSSMVAISFFMSMMYPTIFTLSIRGLGQYTAYASSFIVTGMAGGAFMTAIMGLISDATNIAHSFFAPAICFVYILLFAFFLTNRGFAKKLNGY